MNKILFLNHHLNGIKNSILIKEINKKKLAFQIEKYINENKSTKINVAKTHKAR